MNRKPIFLSNADFFELKNQNKGLIPVSINVAEQKVFWFDLHQYHFYEGFFHKALNTFALLNKGDVACYATDINIFDNDDIITNARYPTGFIFHAGRCGSTLLVKCLARSRKNMVISEAAPLNQIWQVFAADSDQPISLNQKQQRAYRNLVLAMGSQGALNHPYFFIKFTSYNICFFDSIRAIFPDVPAIFITRDTGEIVNSYHKRPPGWANKLAALVPGNYTATPINNYEQIVDGLFKPIAQQQIDELKIIDYNTLNAETLPEILAYFKVTPTSQELALMQSQFAFDAKVEFNKKKF